MQDLIRNKNHYIHNFVILAINEKIVYYTNKVLIVNNIYYFRKFF